MRVAFIDSASSGSGIGGGGASVLIRGVGAAHPPMRGDQDGSPPAIPVEEVYRVRLPHNPYTGRGVVIGEGKPENQAGPRTRAGRPTTSSLGWLAHSLPFLHSFSSSLPDYCHSCMHAGPCADLCFRRGSANHRYESRWVPGRGSQDPQPVGGGEGEGGGDKGVTLLRCQGWVQRGTATSPPVSGNKTSPDQLT